jgi:predicted kinase
MAELSVDLYDEAFRDRLEATFWRHAQEVLRLGGNVILESGFWLRSDRDEKRQGAHALGAAVELRYLDVPLDELWRRVSHRNPTAADPRRATAPITREQLERWATVFEPPTPAEQALFDPLAVP